MKLAAEAFYIGGTDVRIVFAVARICILAKALIELARVLFFMRQYCCPMLILLVVVEGIERHKRNSEYGREEKGDMPDAAFQVGQISDKMVRNKGPLLWQRTPCP